jgi:hypothetical protein
MKSAHFQNLGKKSQEAGLTLKGLISIAQSGLKSREGKGTGAGLIVRFLRTPQGFENFVLNQPHARSVLHLCVVPCSFRDGRSKRRVRSSLIIW